MDDNTVKVILGIGAILAPMFAALTALIFALAKRELAQLRGDVRDLKTQTNGLTKALVEVNRSDAGQEGETRGRRMEKALTLERIEGAAQVIQDRPVFPIPGAPPKE